MQTSNILCFVFSYTTSSSQRESYNHEYAPSTPHPACGAPTHSSLQSPIFASMQCTPAFTDPSIQASTHSRSRWSCGPFHRSLTSVGPPKAQGRKAQTAVATSQQWNTAVARSDRSQLAPLIPCLPSPLAARLAADPPLSPSLFPSPCWRQRRRQRARAPASEPQPPERPRALPALPCGAERGVGKPRGVKEERR